MPALAPIFLTALAFALLMLLLLGLCCIFAPMEEELWPDLYEEKKRDGLDADGVGYAAGEYLDSGEFIPADELNAQQPPRRAGLRIVRD